VLVGELIERRRVADAEVVDENVRRLAEAVEHEGHRPVDAGGRGQIGRHGVMPACLLRRQCICILIGDDDLRPFLGQQIGDRLADAVRAGGDEGPGVLNLVVHSHSLVRVGVGRMMTCAADGARV
jgi:hypothetical protein